LGSSGRRNTPAEGDAPDPTLVPQPLRQVVAELLEVLGDEGGLLLPDLRVDREQDVQVGVGEVQAVAVERVPGRQVPDRGLDRVRRAVQPFSRSAVQPFSRSAVPRSTSGRVAGRLVVLHAGRIVEDLPAHALDDAGHPETRRLLDATALTAKWT
jgi:hypothetical protein